MTLANGKEKPQGKLERVMLVPYGRWEGHSRGVQEYGPVECEAMAEYFNATAGAAGKPVVIDYEHQSITPNGNGGVPAAGWIWSVEHVATGSDPGLYGMVEWTPAAKEAIRNNEYRYISPVIGRGSIDPVSGEPVPIQLFNAALTNMPFMADRMNAVSANTAATEHMHVISHSISPIQTTITNTGGSMDPAKMLEDVKAALGLGADAKPEDVLGFLKKLVDFMGMLPGAPAGGTAPAPDALPQMETEMKQAVANSAILANTAQLLGVQPSDVLARVGELKNAASAAPDAAAFSALKEKVAKMEAEKLVDANTDRIAPVDREFYLNFAVRDYDAAKEIIARLQPVVTNSHPLKSEKTSSTVPDDVTLHYREALNTTHMYKEG